MKLYKGINISDVSIKALANAYVSLHFIDIEDDHFEEIDSIPPIHNALGESGQMTGNFERLLRMMVHEEYVESTLEFVRLDNLTERLKGKTTITHEVMGKISGWCRLNYFPISYDDDGNLKTAIFATQAIDDEKKREIEYRIELQRAEEKASAASKAKSDFISNMSHEIRTPINAVLGMNEMILRESKDPKVLEYAEDIRTAGNTLLSLINDILDFSKIESGKMELVCEDYDLYTLIHDSVSMVRDRALKKGLEIIVHTSPDMPAGFYGDEKRISQIIVNLMTNAVKYTEKGTITLNVYTEIIGNKPALSFSVKDTGIGISEEDMKGIFDVFQRADLKHNKTIEGTGLGLAITRNLVDLMDGRIFVTSEFGKGSEFTVRIPQKVTDYTPVGVYDEKKVRVNAENSHKQIFTAPSARILVVDDVKMNLKVIRAFLNDSLITVDTAESGQQCLEMVAENSYDIIFMDYMMPIMDGVETFRRMCEMDIFAYSMPPVIMLTANAIAGESNKFIAMGFADYLTKPVNSTCLDEALLKFLPKNKIEYITAEGEDEKGAKSDLDVLAEAVHGIDPTVGLSYCCDSLDFYKEMLNEYCLSDRLKKLNVMFADEDWENYRVQVHSLKSTSLTIGLSELSEMAKAVELAAKSMDIGFIKAHHSETVRKYRTALDEIRAYLKSQNCLHD